MASVSAEPRHPAVLAILLAALVLTGCAEREEPAPGPPAAKAAVDGERIANADSEPGSWLSHGRTYSEQRFSPLTQITRDNVGRLGLAWYADLDTRRGQEATPLMVDGVIYVSTAWSKVKAFDAKTGEAIWAFDPQVPGEWAGNACCDVVNRGVAVWQGKVFVGTLDGRLITLDAATGDKLWDVTTIDRSLPYTITGAPRVVKGKVLIGNGGAEFGVRGYVSAYDADSGEMAWRFYTVPGDPAKGFEQPILEKAAETWSGQWWRLGGGGTVWDSMAYDPGLDLLYIGTGNGSPWNHSLRSEGKGDNLFLASIVALRPDTGEYVWHYQSTPGESWDHTATQQITIADLTIDGRERRVLMQLPKNGFFYVIDAATGELVSAKNVTEIAWATHVDIATGRPVENPAARYDVTGKPFLSTHNPMGVHTWHSMSYSPQTGLVYVPIHGTPFVFGRPESFNPTGMAMNTGADHSAMATMDAADVLAKTYGRLIAWDPVNQKEVWRVERAGQANGGALSTAGGLVFQGTGSGEFTALDAATGASLWSAPTQTGVVAAPISYSVDGEQYVAIMVGTGGLWAMVGGGANMKGVKLPNVSRLLVYKLGGTVQLPAERAVTALPIDPPANEAAGEVIGRGAARYRTFCASCHGAGAVGVGLLPDLRRTPFLRSEQAWENVVLGGAFKAHGMASFGKVLDADDAKAIRQFVILRAAIAAGNPEAITFGDANADGLTDVFVRTNAGSDWSYRINTGKGFTGGGLLALSNYREQARVVDVNGDGRVDFLYLVDAGTYKGYYVRHALPAGGFAASGVQLPGGQARLCSSSSCNQNAYAPVFADFDGDGNLDFLSLKLEGSQIGATLSRPASRQTPRDTITRITNGFGAVTEIRHAPLTNAALHRRDHGSRDTTNWGRGAPVSDLLMPMYAVASVSSSSPQAGDPNAMATVHYRYAGSRMQAGGRGFLGFREIVTFDPNQAPDRHVVTGTLYYQNFPYVGMPAETTKRVVSSAYAVPACLDGGPFTEACFSQSLPERGFPAFADPVFSRSVQVWEADRDIGAGAAGYAAGVQTPVHVRTAGTDEEVRDPFDGGAITSRVATTFGYAAYGNVTMTDVRTYDGAGSLAYTVTTSNSYAEDNPAKWRLGRLTHSTVTHARPGVSSIQRKSAFKYAMSGAATGLLEAERAGYTESDGSGPADQNLLKTYALDAYGNRLSARTCANSSGFPTVSECNAALTQFRPANARAIHRYGRTVYDALGRYPVETWEPFWNGTGTVERKTATIHARNPFGDVTHASDVNGVQIKALYGSLGRAYYAWQQTTVGGTEGNAATGVRTLTRYRWCGAGTGQVTCPAGAKFRQEVLTTEAPGQWTYLDVLGRPILQAAQTFNVGVSGKEVSAACTTYDAAGKPRRVSSPFFLPGTVGASGPTVAATACTDAARLWTTTTYDVLGRPVAVSTPDEAGTGGFATATTTYSGLSTTVTDPRGKATTTLNWATGELRRVTDANGIQVDYGYRADGSVVYVDRDAGRGTVRNAFVYDTLGRKVQQTDPDSGVTTFEYNALGELTAQLDAASNRIETWYDARGRIWRKAVKRADGMTESEALFEFDTAANGAGQPAGESITGTYGGWVGQTGTALSHGRTYAYDTLGRPVGSTTTIDGTAYTTAAAYDVRGRAWKARDASGKWLKTQFTAHGAVKSLCESSAADAVATCPNDATTYLTVLEADARGNAIRERRGNSAAMDVVREYWQKSGRIAGLCAGNASTCGLMDEGYGWDAAGNLSTQVKEDRYVETFTYDNLSRLTHAYVTVRNGTPLTTPLLTHWAQYDALGNLCARLVDGTGQGLGYAGRAGCGVATANGSGGTGPVGPHQVSRVGVGLRDYYYDLRGNQTLRDAPGTASDRAIKYSLDDKAHEIDLGGAKTRFWYGADGQRYKREHQGKKTLYLGNVEIETVGGVTTVKRTVGGVLQQSIVGSTVTGHYLFHDHLGSLVRTTNASGTALDGLDYQPFGQRRHAADPAVIVDVGSSLTPRGFTGHEHVDAVNMDVIHMNGRIYDPEVGRFLQADPVIQAPGNLQSWNAYTYVFNNPLKYTDPTGMFSWKKALGWIGVALRIISWIPGMQWMIPIAEYYNMALATYSIANGFAQGGWTGGLTAAFSSMINSYAGANWGAVGALATGIATAGVSSMIMGGTFADGARGALTAIAVTYAITAIAGSAISKYEDRKFANGASTRAYTTATQGGSENKVAARDARIEADAALNVKGGFYDRVRAREFKSASQIAEAWGEVVYPIGRKHGVELGARIYRYRGVYAVGGVYSDGAYEYVTPARAPTLGGKWEARGFVHTHPAIDAGAYLSEYSGGPASLS